MKHFSLEIKPTPTPFWVVPPTKTRPIAFLVWDPKSKQDCLLPIAPLDPYSIEHSADIVETDPHNAIWAPKVHVYFRTKSSASTVDALVEVNLHMRHAMFDKVYVPISVDYEQPMDCRVAQAVALTQDQGRYFSWVQWVNKRLMKVHPRLWGDPDFVKAMKKLSDEHQTKKSSAGRKAVEEIMKIGAFIPAA